MDSTGSYPESFDPKIATEFVANGTKYYIERDGGLSVARDRWLEKFSLYSMLGRQPAQILSEIRRAYDAVNAGRVADAGVLLDNLLKGVTDLEQKYGPLYYVCTLFINREGEDRSSYNLEDAKRKIADWEGLERQFFYALAANWLTATSNDLAGLIQIFSGEARLNQPTTPLDLSDG